MPYGFKILKKGNMKQVFASKIHYRCMECDFITTDEDEEKKHFATGHYLKSEYSDENEIYDEKLHGQLPWQTKRQLEM